TLIGGKFRPAAIITDRGTLRPTVFNLPTDEILEGLNLVGSAYMGEQKVKGIEDLTPEMASRAIELANERGIPYVSVFTSRESGLLNQFSSQVGFNIGQLEPFKEEYDIGPLEDFYDNSIPADKIYFERKIDINESIIKKNSSKINRYSTGEVNLGDFKPLRDAIRIPPRIVHATANFYVPRG
ncbi:MAG: hypothetical protein KC506_00725, partial [Nanoarchaeota archaeon]|nr:hypothetical protein [Nanoarchaeota archaeon]